MKNPPEILEAYERGGGKTVAAEKRLAMWLREHPEAVVARVRGGDVRVEKPVEGEVIE